MNDTCVVPYLPFIPSRARATEGTGPREFPEVKELLNVYVKSLNVKFVKSLRKIY